MRLARAVFPSALAGVQARMRVEQRLVWIFGAPRSGSTWLLTILNYLLGAHGVNEPLIGAHLAALVSPVVGQPLPNEPTLAEVRGDHLSYFFAKTKAYAWRPPLRRLLLERLADGSRRGQWIVVKEPNGSLAAPLIMATVPRSRLLFLVRDGRDVVDSLLDGWSGGWLSSNYKAVVDNRERFLYDAARRWVRQTEAVQAAFVAHPRPLRIRVKYEDLRAEPEKHVLRVLRWLGEPELRHRISEVVERTSFDAIPETEKGPGRFARAATPGLWREHFNEAEQARLLSVMGPTLKRFGYEDEV